MQPPPPVLRLVYRALLRASANGRCPEVFGEFAAPWTSGGTALPKSARDVRRALRKAFETPTPLTSANDDDDVKNRTDSGVGSADLFAALRRANQLSDVLMPRPGALPERLPVFEFSGSTALPGEIVEFNFFEPRYVHMAREAVGHGGTRHFVLRGFFPSPLDDGVDQLAILLKIIDHRELASGNVAVQCMAGQRMAVDETEEVEVAGGQDPLTVATAFAKIGDDDVNFEPSDGVAYPSVEELRDHCLDLLGRALPPEQLVVSGVPPLDPELCSFFCLRHTLDPQDVQSRAIWLGRRSARARFEHTSGLVEKFLKARDGDKDGIDL